VNVVLFYSGLGKRGGISPDLWHLEAALAEEGIPLTVGSKFKHVLASKRGRETVVNVYGCLPSLRTVSVMLLARLRGQRLVWTPVFHPRRRSTWKNSGRYQVMAAFDTAAPHLARLTHAVSAATDEEAEFFRAMGAPRTRVIPLVVDRAHRRLEGSERVDARKRLGLGDEPVVLLIAAHSPRRKGMGFASEVLKQLRSELPLATFLVVGGGNLGPLAGQPGVKATGWCHDDVLLDAYRSSDLLFVPSLYEQFSRATIEAWACELPVVVTDGVALAPMTRLTEAGMVVPFGDVTAASSALSKALRDPDWCSTAGLRGRALVEERFLRSDHLRATLELYQSIS
jgi:glycosyltransferase involved in cell wall biosynthesis